MLHGLGEGKDAISGVPLPLAPNFAPLTAANHHCGSGTIVEVALLWKRHHCGSGTIMEAAPLWRRHHCGTAPL